MRHYRFYILFVAVLTLSGCADFLDRDPLEQASENTFWKTEADVEKGVNALYPLLPGERDFWRDCESDNSLMTNSWGENGLGYICQGIHNAATGYLSEEWKYDHIYRILYCLDKLQGMEIKEEKKQRFEGEIRFILALKYYRWRGILGIFLSLRKNLFLWKRLHCLVLLSRRCWTMPLKMWIRR